MKEEIEQATRDLADLGEGRTYRERAVIERARDHIVRAQDRAQGIAGKDGLAILVQTAKAEADLAYAQGMIEALTILRRRGDL